MLVKLKQFIGRQIYHRYTDKRIRLNTDMFPIHETFEQDVFIVGYPKSGNTWFRSIIGELIFGVNAEIAPLRLAWELVPDVHDRKYYFRFSERAYFKSHHLPRPEYQQVIYLVRDGRDVMVSLKHYMENKAGKEIDLLSLFTADQIWPCRWDEHVVAWQENPYRANILIVKYEDLLQSPQEELQKISRFLNVKCDPTRAAEIIARTSLENLRSKHKEMLAYDQRGRSQWTDQNKDFFRRGQTGSYKDELPAFEKNFYTSQFENSLRQLGYSVNVIAEST
jgi:hypothetical protein